MKKNILIISVVLCGFLCLSCEEEEPYELPEVLPILLDGTWFRTGDITSDNDDLGAILFIKAAVKLELNNLNFNEDNTYEGTNPLGDNVVGEWTLEENSVLYLNKGADNEVEYQINRADEIEMKWKLYYSGEKLGTSKGANAYIIMHKREHDYAVED